MSLIFPFPIILTTACLFPQNTLWQTAKNPPKQFDEIYARWKEGELNGRHNYLRKLSKKVDFFNHPDLPEFL